MRFAAVEWLIFLPLILFAAWRWRSLRLWLPLRALCLVLILLVLIEPQIRRFSRGLDLWVLVDQSASAADAMATQLPEWQSLLEKSKSPDDRIFYLDYADQAVVRGEGDPVFPGNRDATRSALAIEFALSRMPPDRTSRILSLTDGYSTEPLGNLGERLLRQGVPLDYRLTTQIAAADYRVEALRMQGRAQIAEPFVIEMEVTGAPDGTVPYEISREGKKMAEGKIEVRNGRGHARFTDRIGATGSHKYTAHILPVGDAHSGNNFCENWIEITGGPRVLIISSYTDDPVAGVLRAQGFEVELVTDPASLSVGRLSGAKAVILNNMPAYKLATDFLGALDFYVRAQGGGLLMAGGKNSFGSGGYFKSAIDDLLPVSMELRMEHRKLSVAMAIVMDRSGSMGMAVPGAGGGVVKMDLANEGAARAIDLLGPGDAVSVIAVDSEPHVVVPLSRPGENRANVESTVRRITSGGGGIYIGVALKAGWEELKKTNLGQKHLILFADAADSEEPADYTKTIDEMVAAGATISVIGLGTDKDSDAHLLIDVAARGNGRIFFNANPAELPAVFAQETVAVARSAFINEPVKLKPAAAWLEIAAKALEWPDAVDGYNLSYLKTDASGAVFSTDEYAAPLVSFWQRGAGRVAAVTFPLGGEYSEKIRAWPAYGDFLQTTTRWLMGEALPEGIGLRTRVDGSELTVDLLYDEPWEQRFADAAPKVLLADGASGAARELTWERLEPGHYQTSAPLVNGQWARGAAQVGKFTIPFGPVLAGSGIEWAFAQKRVVELQGNARMSGGVERVDLTKIWQAPRRSEYRDIRNPLLLALLFVFLAEVLVSRMGWNLPKLGQFKVAPQRVRKIIPQETKPIEAPVTEPLVEVKDESAENRRARFQRAKRGE